MSLSQEKLQKVMEEAPAYLTYEELEGRRVPYRGYESVLTGEQEPESVMGYGNLQLLIINILVKYFDQLFAADYWVLAGGGGLHLSHNVNLAADISFYPKAKLDLKTATRQYSEIPPKIIIEVDTKADPTVLESMDYYNLKTQKLLDFGVEQVIWLFTDSQKVLDARPNRPWLTVNWQDELELMNHTFSQRFSVWQ